MQQYQHLSEIELIDKIVNGDKASFEVIIRRYNPILYKIGRSYGYNHQDVEDLMQETFINAYQHLSSLRERAYFKAWITRVMLNECFRKATLEKKGDVAFFKSNLRVSGSSSTNDTEKNVSNRELNSVIKNAIEHVPLDYRLVFSLRELNCMTVHETAIALNITESNVKVRLNRAKAMLRKEVEKTYTRQEIFDFNLIYCDRIVTKVVECISK